MSNEAADNILELIVCVEAAEGSDTCANKSKIDKAHVEESHIVEQNSK